MTPMTDDEWAGLKKLEREFALRWARMTENERQDFCQRLVAATDVLRRFGILDGMQARLEDSPAA